jgi:hypothetical protein
VKAAVAATAAERGDSMRSDLGWNTRSYTLFKYLKNTGLEFDGMICLGLMVRERWQPKESAGNVTRARINTLPKKGKVFIPHP